MAVSIGKFRIVVLVSNGSNTEVTIRFEISNIRTATSFKLSRNSSVRVRSSDAVEFAVWKVVESAGECAEAQVTGNIQSRSDDPRCSEAAQSGRIRSGAGC